MDILVNRTLYMSCQAGPGIEPGPSALKASALPIELTWQTCIGFHCVVITIVQLYNICLFLVDKVNYFYFIIGVLV